MKILFIGNFTGPSWDGSIPDEEHIAGALEESGHEVIRLQREEAHKLFWEGQHFDFTLVSQWDGYNSLYALPKPIVYWAFDYQADGQEWHERLVNESDLYLSKRIADNKYSNWQWLAQDFSPEFLDWQYSSEKEFDVLFTGSYLDWATERNDTLRAINDKFNLTIFSVNAWPEEFKDVRSPVMDHGLPALYSKAKVVISIDHTIEPGYWSDRNAQIMCCGTKPLFRYVPLSESTFHDHVRYFYNIDDCLEKIDDLLLLGNWEKGAEESYEYAQNNLKIKNRVSDLLTIVESIL